MAKFTPSSLISEIRGSVGVITYSKNRYGPVAKAKLAQTNPDTVYQQLRREACAEGVAAWQSMSDADVLEWFSYVQSHKNSNSLAHKFNRSAYNELVSRYVNRSLVLSMDDDFPAFPSVRRFPILDSVTFDTDEININWHSLENPGSTAVIIYASAPMSPGIRSINPNFVKAIVGFNASALSGSENIYNDYVTRFLPGPADADKRIFFAVKAVNTDNFADSAKSFNQAICPNIFPGSPLIFDSTFDYTYD